LNSPLAKELVLSLRRVHILVFFSIALVLGGLALVAPVAPQLLSSMAVFDEPRNAMIAAAILVLLGAVSGLLALRHMRRACTAIEHALDHMTSTGDHTVLESGDYAVAGIVRALNTYTAASQQRIDTARRRAREVEIQLKIVQLERAHVHSILQSINDAVLVTDAWDELVMTNDSAARALGFKRPETGRHPIDELLKDPRLVSLMRETRTARTGRRITEHEVRHGNENRTYKVTLSCLGGASATAEAPGVVAVMHDVTHEVEVARHELRTPLASIRAYVEMLLDGEASDEKQAREFYDVIQNEANRLSRLIDNILDLSRIEAGVVKVNKQPLSMTVVVNEALEIITPQASGKNISIKTHVAPLMHQVNADHDMIHRAVLNLLSNAVKYTPDGGTVSVSTVVDEVQKRMTVNISDTGVGIPPKDLPFVFDKFYRVEANSRMAKGTGLGLSLVKHIVEAVHLGRVTVESNVGRGSRFSIELDLC
jgi:two-component system, OmpR family, phosphate regulon sensor histidine kinase PhoR